MNECLISESRLAEGRWTGRLRRDELQSETPEIGVFLGGSDLGDVLLSPYEDSQWKLEFPIPGEVLGDGVSTFVFVDRQTSEPLGRFCIVAGAVAQLDVLAQLDALQIELDQLKSAFRRQSRRKREGF